MEDAPMPTARPSETRRIGTAVAIAIVVHTSGICCTIPAIDRTGWDRACALETRIASRSEPVRDDCSVGSSTREAIVHTCPHGSVHASSRILR
jgi:hypothetical protein